jgi:hypothetical protein
MKRHQFGGGGDDQTTRGISVDLIPLGLCLTVHRAPCNGRMGTALTRVHE